MNRKQTMTAEELLQPYYYPSSGKVDYQGAKKAMKEYARIKCLEAIKNTRHKSIEILEHQFSHVNWAEDLNFARCEIRIQNIPNEDVMPEL